MKKYQIILISFAALLLMIGAASAADVDDIANDTTISSISDAEDILTSDNHSDVLQSNKEFEGSTFSELRNEISSCGDNDTIFLNNDITQDGTSAISITKQLIIDGRGHTIDAQKKSGIINIDYVDNVILKNIIFKNANGRDYGAVFASGTNCIIDNCTFIDNVARGDDCGGAITTECLYYHITSYNIVNCNFIGNSAKNGGAIYFDSNLNIINCSFINNSASSHGSAIYGREFVRPGMEGGDIYNCTFINGTSIKGGAISLNIGKIRHSRFINNSATLNGGAIYTDGQFNGLSKNIIIEDCTLKNNHATVEGGAIYSQSENFNINNCSFIENTAGTGGGAVYLCDYENSIGGSVTNSMFISNSAEYGGSIYNEVNTTLSNDTFKQNHADMGGAVYCDFYTNLIYCNFENNNAENGGAVFNKKDISLSFSNFTSNNAQKGGAIYCTDYVGTLIGSDFTRNSAVDGGAIYCDVAQGEVRFNKFINNTASNGGAVFLNLCNQLDINYNTLFYNSANEGGAFYTINSNNTLVSNFFINNTALKGGALYSSNSTNMMEYCGFEHNEADEGGAILLNKSQSNIIGSYFDYNVAFEKGSAIYWTPLGLNVNCSISSSQFFNNKVKSYYLNASVEMGILFLDLIGWNNYINAIYADTYIELKDVTYWNGNETNTDVEAFNNGASGQNITLEIYDSENNLVVNTTLVTNTYGEQYYDLFLWDDGYYTYRAYLSDYDYYTYVENRGNFTLSRSSSLIGLNITDYDEFNYNDCTILLNIVNRTDIRVEITNEDGSIIYYNSSLYQYSKRVTVDLPASDEYYKITVYNLPTGRFAGSKDSKLFKIIKTGSSISIDPINDFNYTRSPAVTFNVDNRTDIDVTIYDENGRLVYENITNTDYIIVPKLPVGKYSLNVTNIGNENISSSSNSTTFNILKETNSITISANDVYYGNNTVITVLASVDGNYTLDINGNLTNVTVMRGQCEIELFLPSGEYYANITFNNPNYNVSITNATFNVLKADNNVQIVVDTIEDSAVITIQAQVDGIYALYVNGSIYSVNVYQGQGSIELSLPDGKYYANATFHNPNYNTVITNATFTVLTASKVEVSYDDDIVNGESVEFYVTVNNIATGNITLRFGNDEYNATISNASAMIEVLNVGFGDHGVSILYGGDENYDPTEINFTVHVKTSNFMFEGVQSDGYSVKLYDEEGNGISNREVTFLVDGETFTATTDSDGIANLGLDLTSGDHNVQIIYLSLNITEDTTVASRFGGNKNINMYYFDGSKYTFTVYGYDGKPVGANEKVVINLNKKTYNVKTDKNGVVTFTIPNTVKIGTYTITASYKGQTIKNTVKVNQILSSKKTVKVKKTAKKLVLQAKLKKKLKGKKIVFKFKGKKYTAKTNKNGIAKVTIKKKVIKKLKKGKTYKVYISYYNTSLKTKVKVR